MTDAASPIHIPEASSRPGQHVHFGNLKIPAAGIVPRPESMVAPSEIRDLAFTLIRVLDENDQAVGPWKPHLDPETLRLGLRHMMLTRTFDERMQRMHRQGKLSFYMQCTGEEAVAVAQGMALKPSDMLFAAYRQQGLLIVRSKPLFELMCQCLSNSQDSLKGRQLPILYSWKEGNFFTLSGNLATQFSQAVGWAMAAQYKNTTDIAATWLGDGSTAAPDFHHALTFASVYQAPVILNIVNNQWAISTPQSVAGGEHATFAARGLGYAIPSLRVDGNDFLAVYAATQWAVERARQGGGPTLIEHYTYRVAAHSTSDDPRAYRSKEEAKSWPLGDPIERLKKHLISQSEWSEEQHEHLAQELKDEVTAAWKEAESYGTLADEPGVPATSLFDDVYKELLPHLRRQREQIQR